MHFPRLESDKSRTCKAWAKYSFSKGFDNLVDVTGFEPATPCLQSTRFFSTHSFYHFNY